MAGSLFCAANLMIRSRRVSKKGSAATSSELTFCFWIDARPVSSSASLLPLTMLSCYKLRSFFQRGHLSGGRREIRIDEDGDKAKTRQQVAQQAQSFRFQFVGQQCKACRISARTAEAVDQTRLDWIATHSKDDWNGRRCLLCRHRRNVSAYGCDKRNLSLHKIGGQRRQPVVLARCPSVFNDDVLAVDKSCFAQALLERSNQIFGIDRSATTHEANDRRGRLRLSHARPQSCGSKKSNEKSSFHVRPQYLLMVAQFGGFRRAGETAAVRRGRERCWATFANMEFYPAFRRPAARVDFRATSFAGFFPVIGNNISF
jgi:hypothetical protein